MIRLLCFIALIVAVTYLLSVDSPAAEKVVEKPDEATCLTPNPAKWSAKIEEQPDGAWACVMRRLDGKGVKVFFYGDATK